ncbi:MAG: hypothetical protein ACO1OK_12795 [Devosia sp.]
MVIIAISCKQAAQANQLISEHFNSKWKKRQRGHWGSTLQSLAMASVS